MSVSLLLRLVLVLAVFNGCRTRCAEIPPFERASRLMFDATQDDSWPGTNRLGAVLLLRSQLSNDFRQARSFDRLRLVTSAQVIWSELPNRISSKFWFAEALRTNREPVLYFQLLGTSSTHGALILPSFRSRRGYRATPGLLFFESRLASTT